VRGFANARRNKPSQSRLAGFTTFICAYMVSDGNCGDTKLLSSVLVVGDNQDAAVGQPQMKMTAGSAALRFLVRSPAAQGQIRLRLGGCSLGRQ
jgi:hypothetical protein